MREKCGASSQAGTDAGTPVRTMASRWHETCIFKGPDAIHAALSRREGGQKFAISVALGEQIVESHLNHLDVAVGSEVIASKERGRRRHCKTRAVQPQIVVLEP